MSTSRLATTRKTTTRPTTKQLYCRSAVAVAVAVARRSAGDCCNTYVPVPVAADAADVTGGLERTND